MEWQVSRGCESVGEWGKSGCKCNEGQVLRGGGLDRT